jgi:hypothetical protein
LAKITSFLSRIPEPLGQMVYHMHTEMNTLDMHSALGVAFRRLPVQSSGGRVSVVGRSTLPQRTFIL